jgi:UDP-2,3-diacylglucosamine pyrophosphatase LpxH
MKMIMMGKKEPVFEKLFDEFFESNEQALQYIRHAYKAGTTTFYINVNDNDLLYKLKALHDSGKMKHLKLKIHNDYGDYNFVKANSNWMEAYE